ncbi:[FeFe] hydrogenase H-cluster maturation GTPase HydF [Desulforamulus ruminis]|uniref:Small GTP-binding protein n=1 Tax=Desulforamulus ruminis (strain ATCC 23193 / DSM 2154 / NCIMB 8452 / DL) TaxID=696281 RepID=F6DSB9_DESRL|nr:[FeFe] hydrogenase H-cluster maturation GTPase HydF [Desulforamulus ruminis]AEG59898.1 small GTP-binding protein [Desulforamulus ruminis DSM 2154]
MNSTPRGNRLHIAIFGRRNAGKSSLINALTNQDIAVVSNVPGTTTDPVYKAMEILPVGPVVMIDTAGIDDTGELGELRVRRSIEVLNKADMVLLVMDAGAGITEYEMDIAKRCQEKKLPVVAVLNKIDASPVTALQRQEAKERLGVEPVAVSALTREGISDLKIALVQAAPPSWDEQTIVGDLLNPGDVAVLVIPIDLAAPKGRLILPQVQTIRDILDHDAMAYMVKERELKECIRTLNKKPRMVITDSQAFLKADADTPPDVLLTSFSILFARYKGDLETLVAGAKSIEKLRPGDKVLIAEACSHHRMEDDIGTVKIPRWIRQIVGGDLDFHWSSGHRFPEDLAQYKLVVHCGSCMINRREMLSRIMQVQAAGVPIVNYGVCIAYVQGILRRALSPFPLIQEILDDED